MNDRPELDEAVLSLARSYLSTLDPTEVPLGDSDACLRAVDLADMVDTGTDQRQLGHLLRCVPCRENLARLHETASTAPPTDEVVETARRTAALRRRSSVTGEHRPHHREPRVSRPRMRAVLGVRNTPVIVTSDGVVDALEIDLIPMWHAAGSSTIDESKLMLTGALTSQEAKITGAEPQLLTIEFANARVERALGRNLRVTPTVADVVEVHGEANDDEEFAATASVDFVRAGA